MIPIIDLLNKIKWDKKENPEDYTLIYFDRIEETSKELKYKDIKSIKEPFILINQNINIPLHRITQVRKKGVIVWQR